VYEEPEGTEAVTASFDLYAAEFAVRWKDSDDVGQAGFSTRAKSSIGEGNDGYILAPGENLALE